MDYKYKRVPAIETESGEDEFYRVHLEQDEYPLNPREDMDNLGVMFCKGGAYGDRTDARDIDGFKRMLIAELGISADAILDYFEKAGRLRKKDDEWVLYDKKGVTYSTCEVREWLDDDAVDIMSVEEILELSEGRLIMLPLYFYDHGGVTMNTTGFSCRWDSGLFGFIYTTLDKAKAWFGQGLTDEEVRERAKEEMEGEVKLYDDYISGNVFMAVTEKYYLAGVWLDTAEYNGGFYLGSDRDENSLLNDVAIETLGDGCVDECPDLPVFKHPDAWKYSINDGKAHGIVFAETRKDALIKVAQFYKGKAEAGQAVKVWRVEEDEFFNNENPDVITCLGA